MSGEDGGGSGPPTLRTKCWGPEKRSKTEFSHKLSCKNRPKQTPKIIFLPWRKALVHFSLVQGEVPDPGIKGGNRDPPPPSGGWGLTHVSLGTSLDPVGGLAQNFSCCTAWRVLLARARRGTSGPPSGTGSGPGANGGWAATGPPSRCGWRLWGAAGSWGLGFVRNQETIPRPKPCAFRPKSSDFIALLITLTTSSLCSHITPFVDIPLA